MPNKILLIDIETSPNLAYVWEKYQQDVIAFKKEREIICFAYQWLGEKRVSAYYKGLDLNPHQFIKKLHSLFDRADVIVAHNGDHFDIKMCNTSFIKEGLTPPSPYKTIDTKKIAYAKFRFNSNSLNDLGTFLGLGNKVETGGFRLWLKCMEGDKKSMIKMKKYNVGDIVLLEKVFNILRPWAKTPEIYHGMRCPSCGGNVQSRGKYVNRVFETKRYQCSSCGKWGLSNLKVKHLKGEYVI